jgi:DNA invertase Pin-like site-specific DNA recombinase
MENGMMRVALYARCSTHDKGQDPEIQLSPLREYCQRRGFTIIGEYVDIGVSGDKDRRPELDRLVSTAKKHQIDCIVVWKLDKWGRSLKHLINSLSELQSLGVSFVSYSENIDLSTPSGKMMFHVIGAIAEFERELIRDRVKAGLDNARRNGKTLGRKPVPPIDRKKILDASAENPSLSINDLAKAVNMKPATVYKTLRNYRDGKLSREGFQQR